MCPALGLCSVVDALFLLIPTLGVVGREVTLDFEGDIITTSSSSNPSRKGKCLSFLGVVKGLDCAGSLLHTALPWPTVSVPLSVLARTAPWAKSCSRKRLLVSTFSRSLRALSSSDFCLTISSEWDCCMAAKRLSYSFVAFS